MKFFLMLSAAAFFGAGCAQASPGPVPLPASPRVAEPRDIPYPGVNVLAVDASDTDHRVVRVRETIPVATAGDLVLLYPQWLPGTHAPQGVIDRFAGLVIRAGGQRLAWTRDAVNVFAFHVPVPAGVSSLDVEFQYLSPVGEKFGPTEISSTIATLEWNALALYPAGYFARQIPVRASLTLPAGWSFATALETDGVEGATIRFKTIPLETLIDSPVYAGVNVARFDLGAVGGAPVRLNVFADKAGELVVKPEQLTAHKALVQQAVNLFGSHHFDHYDFLLSISDLTEQQGLEHHRSSEDGVGAGYFTDNDKALADLSLLPHEFTHSWNGKFRRPADLWTPSYDVPMRDSLLWVYEGQTEYWGEVLTARSGLRNPAQERDSLALTLARFDRVPGRRWRPLQDTTSDEIINSRRPQSWHNWQRFEDYYDEGVLIWLDADTLIRERSGGKKSLDDFARAFFGVDDGAYTPVTYRFDDVVAALNAVQPFDWATFLRTRLDAVDVGPPFDGLKRSGYRLVYDETPNVVVKSAETGGKFKSYAFSLGFDIDKDGLLDRLDWDGPAAKTGLTAGVQLMAVNGLPYSDDVLADAVKASKTSATPMELIVKTADRFKVVKVDYHGGLRYPHLVRDPTIPDRLNDILTARN